MAEAAAILFGVKILAVVLPPVLKIARRAKLCPNDDKINKDIKEILTELMKMNDEEKEKVRGRVDRIERWLKR